MNKLANEMASEAMGMDPASSYLKTGRGSGEKGSNHPKTSRGFERVGRENLPC